MERFSKLLTKIEIFTKLWTKILNKIENSKIFLTKIKIFENFEENRDFSKDSNKVKFIKTLDLI